MDYNIYEFHQNRRNRFISLHRYRGENKEINKCKQLCNRHLPSVGPKKRKQLCNRHLPSVGPKNKIKRFSLEEKQVFLGS